MISDIRAFMAFLSHMISVGCEDTAIPFNGPVEEQSATSSTQATSCTHLGLNHRQISLQTNLRPIGRLRQFARNQDAC